MLLLYVFLLIAFFSILMVFLMKFTLKIMGRAIGERVGSLHRDAQFLTETGEMLPQWKKKEVFNFSYQKYSRFIHGEFRRLYKYFNNAPVFEEEETRTMILDKLKSLEEKFCSKPYYEENVNKEGTKVNT